MRALGGLERTFYWLDQAGSTNLTAIVRLQGPLDVARVRRCLELAAGRHPLLAARIDRRLFPRFAGGAGPAIPLQCDRLGGPDAGADPLEAELSTPLPTATGPLARMRVLSEGDRHLLLWTLHHAIADGASLGLLVQQLLADYDELTQGREPRCTPGPLPPSVEQVLAPRAAHLPDWRRLTPFFWRHALARLRGGGTAKLRPAAGGPSEPGGGVRVVQRALEPPAVAELTAACRRAGVTVHAWLCATALQAALPHAATRRGRTPVACMHPINLRGLIEGLPSDALSMYVSTLATYHAVAAGDSPVALARAVQGQIRRALDRGEHLRFVELQGLLARAHLPPRWMSAFVQAASPGAVVVTNMGRVALPRAAGGLQVQEVQAAVSTNAMAGDALTLAAATVQGRLFLNLLSSRRLLSDAQAAGIADRLIEGLSAAP